jgi:integrase
MLTDDQLAAIVQDFYGYVLEEENKLRLRFGRIPEEVRARRAEHFSTVAKQARADLGANEFGSVAFITEAMVRKHKLIGQLDEIGRNQLSQTLMRGGIELAEAVRARYEGDFTFEPRDKLLARKVEALFSQPRAPEQQASAAPEEKAASESGPLFAKTAADFVAKQKLTRSWENQTALQNEKSYELFEAICGNRPLRSYTRKDAATFKDVLQRLPSDYGKASRYLGKAPDEILALDAEAGSKTPRLAIKTVKRHLSALSSLWEEMHSHDEAAKGIFSGFQFSKQKRARDQRALWSRDDLKRLFKTPIWTGCQSAGRRTLPGSMIIRDERFWIPLIAVFSGARQEEICQLRIEDIQQQAGIWVFDINDEEPRQLKNASAVRIVPIHRELIQIGFLKYVEVQRRAGQDRVFPNLGPGGADDRFGHGFTKWFTRYRRAVGLYKEGKDFHSFRHSATTFLGQGDVEDSIIDRLTGHTTPGETSRYNKESFVAQLKKAIDSINIEVDLSALYEEHGEVERLPQTL